MQNAAMENGLRIEFGPNWIHGLDAGYSDNPIYAMAVKHKLASVPTNYSNIATFDHNGRVDMEMQRGKLEDAWATYLATAGKLKISSFIPCGNLIYNQGRGYLVRYTHLRSCSALSDKHSSNQI